MTIGVAEFEEQRIDLQFGPDVEWSELFASLSSDLVVATFGPLSVGQSGKVDDSVRAMYSRLADEYEAQPVVPDLGGGVKGDRYPL